MESAVRHKNLFVTGTVGVGKTSLVKEVIRPYLLRAGGFFTEEVRVGGARSGFLLKTLDGREGMLARKGLKVPDRVGKYGVDIPFLESVGVDALEKACAEKELIVIDEIGSMEMLSGRFHRAVMRCLSSKRNVLATVRSMTLLFSRDRDRLADTKVLVLTRERYDAVRDEIRDWIKQCLTG